MDFTIRNLPAPVLDDLERSARPAGRSVNDEAIGRLETDPGLPACVTDFRRRIEARVRTDLPNAESIEARLARIRALRASFAVPPLTQEFLDEAINEGRP